MKKGSSLPRDILISGGLIAGIIAALQAAMIFAGLEVGPGIALGAAGLIALILVLAASSAAR
jgi:hypothetical protein